MKGTTLRSLCLCPKLPGLRAFRRESLPQKGIWGHGVLEATVDSDLAGRGSPWLREGRPDTEGPGEPVRPPPAPAATSSCAEPRPGPCWTTVSRTRSAHSGDSADAAG